MLALIVVAIMLGFPTAFTLMGMGMMFTLLFYTSANPRLAMPQTLDLMVQRAYAVMTNDVLISIPLFVFMGYLVERANLIEKLFKSLHLATGARARLAGGRDHRHLRDFRHRHRHRRRGGDADGPARVAGDAAAGYNVKLAAGAITAGGCLGILIPPSVLLIVYGATAGVSVVQLYAGAFFPGIMLAALYVGYVIVAREDQARTRAAAVRRASGAVPLPRFRGRIARTRAATRWRACRRAQGQAQRRRADAHAARRSCSSRCCRRWRSQRSGLDLPRRDRAGRRGRPSGLVQEMGGAVATTRQASRNRRTAGAAEGSRRLQEPPAESAQERAGRGHERRSRRAADAAKPATPPAAAGRTGRARCRRPPGTGSCSASARRASRSSTRSSPACGSRSSRCCWPRFSRWRC